MKRFITFALLSLSFAFCAFADEAQKSAEKPMNYKMDDFRNYYGAWAGLSQLEYLKFCQNMGYKYVTYRNNMEKFKESKGMYFIFVNPEHYCYDVIVDAKKKYSPEQIARWRDICAMKDASLPFPDCMATGWFYGLHTYVGKPDYSRFSLQLNFQKQKVIDMAVAEVVKTAKAIMKKNPDFKYAGCIWDVPMLTGDFYGWKKGWKRPRQVGLSHWRGVDSVSVPEGEKLDYKTYSEGYLAFLRKLRVESDKIAPSKIKFIVDPWDIYSDYIEHFVRLNIPPTDDAFADLIQTEAANDKFIKDKRILESGYIDIEHIGQASDLCTYEFDKEIYLVAIAAVNGVWTSWFGNPTPSIPTIRDVPARMKITRALGTWENLNNTPLSKRKWNPKKWEYTSPTAYMSREVVWAIQPERNRLLFSMLDPNAKIEIPDGWEFEKMYALTSIFDEYHRPKLEKNFDITPNSVSLKEDSSYLVGQGFVIYLKQVPKGK